MRIHRPPRGVPECVFLGLFCAEEALRQRERKEPYQFNNAPNVMSFVDGHVSYIRIYWNGVKGFDGISAFYGLPPDMSTGVGNLRYVIVITSAATKPSGATPA